MAHYQLEGGRAHVNLRERALVARLHRAVVYEHDAALLQRARGGGNVGRAEPDAHQPFFPDDVFRAGRRLDQLEVELAAGTFEERALGQDAEILSLRVIATLSQSQYAFNFSATFL